MGVSHSVLLVELVMSTDRLIESARTANAVDGEWAPATIVGHVSQVDRSVWLPRLELMLNAHRAKESVPSFVWWEPDADETAKVFAGTTLDEAAAAALHARTALVMTLRDLSADDWNASAIHDTFGELTVADLMLQVLAHDEEHRGTLVFSQT